MLKKLVQIILNELSLDLFLGPETLCTDGIDFLFGFMLIYYAPYSSEYESKTFLSILPLKSSSQIFPSHVCHLSSRKRANIACAHISTFFKSNCGKFAVESDWIGKKPEDVQKMGVFIKKRRIFQEKIWASQISHHEQICCRMPLEN